MDIGEDNSFEVSHEIKEIEQRVEEDPEVKALIEKGEELLQKFSSYTLLSPFQAQAGGTAQQTGVDHKSGGSGSSAVLSSKNVRNEQTSTQLVFVWSLLELNKIELRNTLFMFWFQLKIIN